MEKNVVEIERNGIRNAVEVEYEVEQKEKLRDLWREK